MERLNSLISENKVSAESSLAGAAKAVSGNSAVTPTPTSAALQRTVVPTSPLSGAMVGASPDAAKMAGSQANKLNALRETVKEERDITFAQKTETKASWAQRLEEFARESQDVLNLEKRAKAVAAQKMQANLSQTPMSSVLNSSTVSALPANIQTTLNKLLNPVKGTTPTSQELLDLSKSLNIPIDALTSDPVSALGGAKFNGQPVIRPEALTASGDSQGLRDSFKAAVPAELKLNELKTEVASSSEGVSMTPEQTENHFREVFAAAGMELSPNATYGDYEKALVKWKEQGLKDKAEIDSLRSSNNPAVRAEATAAAREQGFLGVQARETELNSIDTVIAQGLPLEIKPGLTINTSNVTQEDLLKVEEALKDPTFAASTMGQQLSKLRDSGRLEAQLDPEERAAFSNVKNAAQSVKDSFQVDLGGPSKQPLDSVASAFMSEEEKAAARGERATTPQPSNGVMATLTSPTIPQGTKQNVATLIQSPAAQSEPFKSTLAGLSPQEMQGSFAVGNPQVAIVEMQEMGDALKQWQTGNAVAKAEVLNKFLPADTTRKAMAELIRGGYGTQLNIALTNYLGGDKLINLSKPGELERIFDGELKKFNSKDFLVTGQNPLNRLANVLADEITSIQGKLKQTADQHNAAVKTEKDLAGTLQKQQNDARIKKAQEVYGVNKPKDILRAAEQDATIVNLKLTQAKAFAQKGLIKPEEVTKYQQEIKDIQGRIQAAKDILLTEDKLTNARRTINQSRDQKGLEIKQGVAAPKAIPTPSRRRK